MTILFVSHKLEEVLKICDKVTVLRDGHKIGTRNADPELAKLATCLVQVEGVAEKVQIVQGDIFKEDFRGASVVTLYLLPQLNLCVRHRLLAMKPGTRVVSHQYSKAEWKPNQSLQIQGRDVHLWIVPARIDGLWAFQDSEGTSITVDLRQVFATLSGEVQLVFTSHAATTRRC